MKRSTAVTFLWLHLKDLFQQKVLLHVATASSEDFSETDDLNLPVPTKLLPGPEGKDLPAEKENGNLPEEDLDEAHSSLTFKKIYQRQKGD